MFTFQEIQMACDRLVGNTPMINVAPNVWAKMEAYNPTGSIKDRMVNYVLKRVIKEGRVKKGDTVVEATSGNTGIALSFFWSNSRLECKNNYALEHVRRKKEDDALLWSRDH